MDFLQTYPEVDFPQSQHAYLEEVTTTTTTANPAAGDKRARNDNFGLKDYTVVAKKLRRLEQHQLQTIGDWQRLADCEPGEVFVVDGCEEKMSAYGKMSLLNCRPLAKGESKKQVICPARFLEPSLYPCVMVYLGMVEMTGGDKGKSGESTGAKSQQKKSVPKSKRHQQQQMCHALRRYGGLNDVFSSDEEMVTKAGELRRMTVEELRKEVEISRLRDFPPGTVMVYFGHRKLPSTFDNGEKKVCHVVGYQTVIDNAQRTGEVYIPDRYANALKERSSGVLVYKGLKTSVNTGVEFYDLEFVSEKECARVIDNE